MRTLQTREILKDNEIYTQMLSCIVVKCALTGPNM